MAEQLPEDPKVHFGRLFGHKTPRPACNQWIGGLRAIRLRYSQNYADVTCKRCRKAMGLK